jgi:LmbE family N-acetylglucosaminyl deacetylase
LGIPQTDIRFLDYPDGHLRSHKAEFGANIKATVEQDRPTIILGTHPADTHPDHAVVGEVIDHLVSQLQPRPLIYMFLVHYHRYPRPEGNHPDDYLLPPAKLLLAATPWQKFVLSPADQAAKYKAVLAYKSQLSRKNPLLRGLLLSFVRQNELFVIIGK